MNKLLSIKTDIPVKKNNIEDDTPTVYSPASIVSNLDIQLKDSKEKTIWKKNKKFK